MIQYIFGAGLAVGAVVGFKAGKAVGGFGARRKLKKIQKILGNTAEKATKQAVKVGKQAKEFAEDAGDQVRDTAEQLTQRIKDAMKEDEQ